MGISKSEAIKKHRELWNTVADMIHDGVELSHSLDYKEKALKKLGYGDHPIHACYLCQYDRQVMKEKYTERCHNCPIKWTGKQCESNSSFRSCSEYIEFRTCIEYYSTRDLEKAEEWARKIANLPVRRTPVMRNAVRYVIGLVRKTGGK